MVKRFVVEVPGVPPSPSPISNAVVGDTCHISGRLAVYEDGYRAGSARQEAERAFELVFRIAEAAGFGRDDIVYVDPAFADLDGLPEFDALYNGLFENRPARPVYQAARLPFGAKVKEQAIATRGLNNPNLRPQSEPQVAPGLDRARESVRASSRRLTPESSRAGGAAARLV